MITATSSARLSTLTLNNPAPRESHVVAGNHEPGRVYAHCLPSSHGGLAAVVCVPTLASAQGRSRASSRIVPGPSCPESSVEVSSPVADRESPQRRHRRHRSVPHHRSPAWHVHRHGHPAGIQHRQARRHRGHRHRRLTIDARYAGRRSRGNGDHHRPNRRSSTSRACVVRRRLSGKVIADLPTSRSYGALFQLIPAVSGGSRDVQVTPALVVFGGPGGRGTEGRLQVEGLEVGAALSGGGVSSYMPDIGNSQEVTFSTSGGLGEAEVGGPTMNIVPKTGGNSVRGNLYLAGISARHGRQQLHRRITDGGFAHAWQAAEAVGFHRRRGRPDPEGSHLVLRERPRGRQLAVGARHVSQPECRRPDEVHLRAGPHEAGGHGRKLAHRRACG